MSKSLLEKPTETTDFGYKVSVVEEDFTLTSLDRCDGCAAQAYVEVTLTNTGKLLFCAHHYKAQASKLLPLPLVLQVRDESLKLYVKPPVTE